MAEQQIFNAMVEFFEEEDWDFDWMDGMSVLRMGFSGENGRWLCYAQAREAQQQFVFYSVMSVTAPPEKRPAIAEYITRANYGMVIGNFEMDYSDGEIRYKTSVDVEGTTINPALIQQCVYANVIISDRYLPGIMRVIYGDIAPQVALEELASGDVPPDDEYDDTFGYLDEYDNSDSSDPQQDKPNSPNGNNPAERFRGLSGNDEDSSSDNPDGTWN
jgi:hypothetical protein